MKGNKPWSEKKEHSSQGFECRANRPETCWGHNLTCSHAVSKCVSAFTVEAVGQVKQTDVLRVSIHTSWVSGEK